VKSLQAYVQVHALVSLLLRVSKEQRIAALIRESGCRAKQRSTRKKETLTCG
jgi:hypothetical protein